MHKLCLTHVMLVVVSLVVGVSIALAQPISVEIDIKPGSDPNSINLKSKGVVPVAVLGSDTFDASEIDPATVLFASTAPVRSAMEDVDLDGYEDLVLHFKTQELDLDESDTEATLTGQTYGGVLFEGTDSVRIKS